MTESARLILWNWAQAKAAAKKNPEYMLAHSFNECVMAECVARMDRLYDCETEMNTIRDVDAPSELHTYRFAYSDRGCTMCWFSSSGIYHKECQTKIERLFRAEDALFRFAMRCGPLTE